MSCTGRERTKTVGVLEHTAIDMGEHYLGAGGFLAYLDGEVVGVEMSKHLPPFFHLADKDASESRFSFFGSRGRGPNEFLLPYSIQHITMRTVGVFDAMSKVYCEFDVPRVGESPTIMKTIRFQSPASRMLKTAFDQYISLSFGEDMFTLSSSDGSTIDSFFEYPYQDGGERRVFTRAYAYQGSLAANPSKTKFVYAPFRGEILHFYSIEKDRLTVIEKIENEYPLYKDDSHGETQGVSYDARGKNGYIALYATERFVYAIYSGQTVLEQTEKKSVNFEGEQLRVFDWSGTQVKEFRLDVPCSYLCVFDDDTRMWAIATAASGEIIPVSFDLTAAATAKGATGAKPQTDRTAEVQQGGAAGAQPPTDATQRGVPVGASVYNERQTPAGARVYGFDVVTKDGTRNDETRRVMDSIRNLPPDDPLYLSPNERYDVRIDTVNNTIITMFILK